MTLDDLLAEYGKKIGLGPLSLNEHGVCQLVFDGEIMVDIESQRNDPFAYISAVVGPIDPGVTANVLWELLSANLMGRGTGGASLAIDPSRNEVVLWRSLVIDGLTSSLFETLLGDFIEKLESWREQIDALDEFDELDSLPEEPAEEIVMFRA